MKYYILMQFVATCVFVSMILYGPYDGIQRVIIAWVTTWIFLVCFLCIFNKMKFGTLKFWRGIL